METRIRGVLSPKASGSITITENGNYDVVDVANAIVNVVPEEVGGITPEGSITLTTNGVYDVTMYAEVVVDVENVIPEGYVKPSGTLNVTSNGTFDVTEKKNVSVNVPIPDGYIIPSGTLSVTQVGTYDVSTYASATFSVITETKTVTPSVSSQSVTPSSGKYLSQVTVNPIPDNYIIPSGTIEITENGVVDVTDYANANVNIPTTSGYSLKEAVNEYILDKNATNTTGYDMAYLFYMFRNDPNKYVDSEMLSKATVLASIFNYAVPTAKIPDFTVSTGNSILGNAFAYYGQYGQEGKHDEFLPTITFTGSYAQLNSAFKNAYIKKVPKWYFPNASDVRSSEMFADSTLEEVPDWDYSKFRLGKNSFSNCKKLKIGLDRLDNVRCYSYEYLFQNCELVEEIYNLNADTSVSRISMYSTFSGCKNLKTIRGIDMIKTISESSAFSNCVNLTNLTIYNIATELKIASGTSWGHLITKESLIQIIGELIDTGSSRRLTMGSTNLAKLTDVYVKITSTEPDENGNVKLPFEVCSASDEGAMLITNYVTQKHWSLA